VTTTSALRTPSSIGGRSSVVAPDVAASILDRAGRTVTLIDDDCDHAADTKMHPTTA
jgi:hypothetical protein